MKEIDVINFDNNKWLIVRYGNNKILLRIKCCNVSRILYL